jgi:hypothetical protein
MATSSRRSVANRRRSNLIGILIASDVPKALDPLEVRNSENGGPYATRTLLGWAINGPLFRQNKAQGIERFFVNSDVKLNQVVMDAIIPINRDFNESISDVKTEMSQEEAQFMASVRNTATLKNCHYVIALPFKNNDHQISNNKEQVEQRAHWLKQKLLKTHSFLKTIKCSLIIFSTNRMLERFRQNVCVKVMAKSGTYPTTAFTTPTSQEK